MQGEGACTGKQTECVCVCVCVVVGASCYGGTEHVADKRAMVFKEKGRLVKCAPIRHHRLTVP